MILASKTVNFYVMARGVRVVRIFPIPFISKWLPRSSRNISDSKFGSTRMIILELIYPGS